MMTVLTVLLAACCLLTLGLIFSPSFRTGKEVEESVGERPETEMLNVSPEERATRELIGDKKYDEMSHHVSQLLKRHATDSFRTVMLTAGSIERNAMKTLHSLLPGDPVRLQDNTRHGIPDVGVYVGEERIGRLLLDDATEALKTINSKLVTGTYIAEQNSFGESPDISIKLIIFYTTAELPADAAGSLKTPYKKIYNGLRPIVIYQN